MSIQRKFYYFLSPKARRVARRIYYFPIDLIDLLSGKRDRMIPPKGKIYVGAGDFRKQGLHFKQLLVDHAGLKPDAAILDVGCGIGRLAVALTGYLNANGRYDGFDIVKEGINWCTERIASQFPNFHFKHIDLKNDLYNLDTEESAQSFVFPYPDESFNCVVLISVFTHMMPDDVRNYLGQIYRVLKPGDKCLATFFLLNDEVRQRMESCKTDFKFRHSFGSYSLMDKKVKEANVAYEEAWLREQCDKQGLDIELLNFGYWTGENDKSLDFQDVVVLRKK